MPIDFRRPMAAALSAVLVSSALQAQGAAAPAAAPAAKTGVTEATPNGFTIVHTARVAAPPARVYEVLSTQIGRWWNPQHSYSGKGENLSIDPRAGGCFCEVLPNGGSVEHQRVVNAVPGRMLRLSGGLGPLQSGGVAAHLTWQLAADSGATTVTATYVVGGYMQGGLDKLAGVVSFVTNEQLQRLKRFVDTGAPAPK